MARPLKPINWVDVEKLCGLQCTEIEIAQFCGVSVDTLHRACKREYKTSFAEYFAQKRGVGKTSLRRAQWLTAQKGNATMQIWLGKQWLDQRDKQSTEHSGPGGGPIDHRAVEGMTLDELNAELLAHGVDPKALGRTQ